MSSRGGGALESALEAGRASEVSEEHALFQLNAKEKISKATNKLFSPKLLERWNKFTVSMHHWWLQIRITKSST